MYKITSAKASGKLWEYHVDYFKPENFIKFRKLLYTAKHKFLVKPTSWQQYSNSKRVMSNGDICQIKELNSIIQNFRCLHIPQDLEVGTVFRFYIKNDFAQQNKSEDKSKDSPKENKSKDSFTSQNGLDTMLVTVYNQVIGCLYPDEELDESFVVMEIDPTDPVYGNGCYIGWERPDPKNDTGFIVLSNYDKKDFADLLKKNEENIDKE